MRDFFKPRRRRLGVVMLGLACVLAAGWVRSRSITDIANFTYHNSAYVLCSGRGFIGYHRVFCNTPVAWTHSVKLSSSQTPFAIQRVLRLELEGMSSKALIEEMERHSNEWDRVPQSIFQDRSRPNERSVTIPYWSIVIPMTLFSAWLLLGKPRLVKTPVTQPSQPSSV